jgi:hypothetical protein
MNKYKLIQSVVFLFIGLFLIRLIGLPANFTPIIAVAVFLPRIIKNTYLAMLFVIAVMMLTDIMLGLYDGMLWTYLLLALFSFFGGLQKNLYLTGIVSVLAWHLVINFFVFISGHGTLSLAVTYAQAIPFDARLLFSTLLFLASFDYSQRHLENLPWHNLKNILSN